MGYWLFINKINSFSKQNKASVSLNLHICSFDNFKDFWTHLFIIFDNAIKSAIILLLLNVIIIQNSYNKEW
jgi:hypothetical protein